MFKRAILLFFLLLFIFTIICYGINFVFNSNKSEFFQLGESLSFFQKGNLEKPKENNDGDAQLKLDNSRRDLEVAFSCYGSPVGSEVKSNTLTFKVTETYKIKLTHENSDSIVSEAYSKQVSPNEIKFYDWSKKIPQGFYDVKLVELIAEGEEDTYSLKKFQLPDCNLKP